jgi:exopolysaccharide production protein ExoZ
MNVPAPSVSDRSNSAAAPATTAPPAPANSDGFLPLVSRIYELSNDRGRLIPLEGLRGLAVLMVFFVHLDALFGVYAKHSVLLREPSRFLGVVGNGGVDLFFLLSGYLIYGALLRHNTSLLSFLRRRAQRIYPTFLVVLAFYLLLSLVFPQQSKLKDGSWTDNLIYLIQNLLLLPGVFRIEPLITVAWSLSYEFFFYISAALLIGTARMWTWNSRTRVVFFGAIWLGYWAFSFTASASHVRALMFVAGILLHEALGAERFRRSLSSSGERFALAFFLVSLVYTYLLDRMPELFGFFPGWWAGRNPAPGVPVYQGPYKTIALSSSMFWIVAYCLAFDGGLRRALSWAPLRYLGNMSYSYYLIHGVTLQGVALLWTLIALSALAEAPLFLAALLIGFAATWACSTALFHFVEKPFSLRKRDAVRSGRAGRAYA